tara:strand:- start:10023 stop:11516 length:1494 start_codon:yes stop_codon:yes gene_type:complete
MKKHNYKFLVLLPLFILFLNSCEDYFDQAEIPSTSFTDVWTSNNDLEKITAASYLLMKGYNEGIVDMGIMLPTFASDEGSLTENSRFTRNIDESIHGQLHRRKSDDNSIAWLSYNWLSGYEVVRTSNTVINYINDNDVFEDTEAHWKDRMLGENYFTRAFAFYTLIKTYAPAYNSSLSIANDGIIVNTTNITSALDAQSLNSVEEAYSQVVSDLENAIKYLPEVYEQGRDPEGYQDRAKKDAAHFLLARVYFQMGSMYWDKSLEQIDAILNKNTYTLESDPATAFRQTGTGNISSETIFQYVTTARWRRTRLFRNFAGRAGGGRIPVYKLSNYFLQYTGWDDLNEAEKDLRYTNLHTTVKGETLVGKWAEFLDHTPLMRIPELYLTRAIIALKENIGGGKTQAIADLNLIRKRAYGTNYVPLDQNTSIEELIEITNKERAKELTFEGDRLYYMQAIGEEIGCGDRVGEADGCSSSFVTSEFHWGIPQREKDLNNNIN